MGFSMTATPRTASAKRGTSLFLLVAYAVLLAFLAGGFVHMAIETHRQHAIWDDIDRLQTADTEEEINEIAADLSRRNALLFLVKNVGTPWESIPFMKVCTGFDRVKAGIHEPMSRSQRSALRRLAREWSDGSATEKSIGAKLETFLAGEPVSLTDVELSLVRQECEERRQRYNAWQRRVVRVMKQIIDERYQRGQVLGHVMIGEISRLLVHEDDEARHVVGDVLIDVGSPSVKWLKKQLERAPASPVFAVATAEMTEEEKTEQLRRQDTVAKREALRVLRAIGTPEAMDIIEDAKVRPAIAWLFAEEGVERVR